MAKLLSYYQLCPINDEKEFLGLSQGSENGTVINTLGKNIIINFKLSNQKQINSWTVLEKLSSKVVYDFKTKQYVGAFANKWIRCWDQSCSDINKVKKIKLAKPIDSLVSIENKQILVLYSDGTCESLQYAIGERKEDRDLSLACNKPLIDASSTSITSIAYFKTSDGKVQLTYFTKVQKTNEVQLVCFKIDDETFQLLEPIHRLKLARKDKIGKLCGFTVVDGLTCPNLITIWSDKRLFMLPLTDDAMSTQLAPGHFVALISAVNVDQPLSVLGISKDCIAIYGANPAPQDGGSLVLYNTQFKVIESKQFFKTYFSNSRLWVVDKYIFLASGQTLAVVAFRISKEQLSDMIGSQRVTDLSNFVDTECINADGELEEMLEFDPVAQIASNASSIKQEERLNGQSMETDEFEAKYPNQHFELADTFNDDLRSLQRFHIELEVNREKDQIPDFVGMQISSNVNDDSFTNEAIRIITEQLEQCGASETEITDYIIPLLIKSKLSSDLTACLRKYTNISDKLIVRALKYFIELDRRQGDKKSEEDGECNSRSSHLNVVLACSFNPDLILEHLRTLLNFDEVVFVLDHIYNGLKSNDRELDERPQNSDQSTEDSMLLKWFLIILDSSYQQFIISHNPKLIESLAKWKDLVDNYIKTIQSTRNVAAILYNLVQGKPIYRDSSSSKWYSVEEVKLF